MFIFYVDLKLASSLMTCCLLSIVESKLNPSISEETPRVLEMTGFCTELPSECQVFLDLFVQHCVQIAASYYRNDSSFCRYEHYYSGFILQKS